MTLLVVGLSHRTAPVAVLERVAVRPDRVPALLHALLDSGAVAEAMVLSTCNRTEVYAVAERFHAAVAAVSEALGEHSGVVAEVLGRSLTVHWDEAAVEHVFRVACGLESMAVGEAQILGQVRSAYELGRVQGTVGTELHDLLQNALRVGKRVQATTAVGRAGVSLVSVGLELAEDVLGSLAGRRALVVGAGAIGSLAAARLREASVAEVVAASRSGTSAQRLGTALCRLAVPPTEVAALLDRYDVVVTASAGVDTVLDLAAAEGPVRRRGGRPLVLVDLGLPHNVDPAVRRLPGVTLLDLTEIGRRVEGRDAQEDVAAAAALVDEEVRRHLAHRRAQHAGPAIAALRARADDVVQAELRRLELRVDLDPRARQEVERTVRRVVDKLLHSPTVRVRQRAAEPGGTDYATVLRDLFQLDRAAAPDDRTADRTSVGGAGEGDLPGDVAVGQG